jgi:hypothetical protein
VGLGPKGAKNEPDERRLSSVEFALGDRYFRRIPDHADHEIRKPITDSAPAAKSDRHGAGTGDHHPSESMITMRRIE